MGALAGRHPGSVVRVTGPLVEVAGIASASMMEVMMVGPQRISAETVAIVGDRVTLQAYEYTGGLAVGAAVEPTGEPLSGLLGPGLLGNVFDGLMRPLSSASLWLKSDRPPATQDPSVLDRDWTFIPRAEAGSTVTPGSIVGTVPNAGSVEHRVLVPWGVAGEVTWVAPKGTVHALDVVARVRRPGGAAGGDLADQATSPVPGAADRCRPAAHRPARDGPAVSPGQRCGRRRARGIRDRQDHAAATGRQVERRRRDRLRGLRRARQRAG